MAVTRRSVALLVLCFAEGMSRDTLVRHEQRSRPMQELHAHALVPDEPAVAKFTGPDTLIALARYKDSFNLKYVKSARMAGFDGKIILGVHPNLNQQMRDDMAALGVIAKDVPTGPCQLPYSEPESGYKLRVDCSADFPHLKLESARFALANKWLKECEDCKGWVLVSDYGDFYFQRHPFHGMGQPTGNELIFQEEYLGKNESDRRSKGGRGVDNTYWFTRSGATNCYGDAEAKKMGDTPTVNSGSILGGKQGMIKFLTRYQQEFEDNVQRGSKCDPNSCPDQATLNYLLYTGAFDAFKPTRAKYGEGPVVTLGMICGGNKLGHSATDLLRMRDGWVLKNNDELANAVHQDKVCWLNLVIPFVNPRYDQTAVADVLQKYSQHHTTAI